MSKFYSPDARGFFDTSLGDPPDDAVEISEEQHQALLAAQAEGKVIVPGVDGQPAAVDPASAPATIDDYRRAIQQHIDATVQQRGYDSGATCASYISSTNTAWAAEAGAFVAWRDAVWASAYTELAKVQAGEREQPAVADFVAELPEMIWPA